MTPLAAFKPPPENERTIPVFEAVYKTLNDVDRKFPSRRQHLPALIAQYEATGSQFADQARALGLADWLQFTIANRKFGVMFDGVGLDEARRLFHEMERLGYPDVNPLISTRMIWANRLAAAGERDEARTVARELLDDVDELRRRQPDVLSKAFSIEIHEFRERHRV